MENYYSVVLTINPNSTDARKKSSDYIKSNILKWNNYAKRNHDKYHHNKIIVST
jgi:hypothetical protein